MKTAVAALARSTLLEALRDRVLCVVMVFALLLVLFSRVLGWLSVEDPLKMLQDFSLSGMSLLGLFLAMLVGAMSLARDVERHTAATLLTRAVSRGQFILGKYLGLVAVFWCCLLLSAAALAVWLLLWGGTPGPALLKAVLGLLFESLCLTAVALFLGVLTNAVVAAVGTFVFYAAGHSMEALRELTEGNRTPALETFYTWLYRLLPNLEDVNFLNGTTSAAPLIWWDLALGALVMICWSLLFLAGAAAAFRRREL